MNVDEKISRQSASYPDLTKVADAFIDLLHEDFVWIDVATGEAITTGRDAFAAFMREWMAANPDATVTTTPLVRSGNLISHVETFEHLADGSTARFAFTWVFDGDAVIRQYGLAAL